MKKAWIEIHLAVALWGFTGVLGRAITLSAPVLVWYRMAMTALFLAMIVTQRKLWTPIARKDRLRLALIGCLMGLHWVAFYGAIKFANVSIALICLSTASIFTAILDPLVNKSNLNRWEILLGSIAVTGVYLIYRFQQFYGVGILLGLMAALLSATFTVFNKGIAGKYPTRTMVFYEMATGWLFISLLLPLQFYFQKDTALLPQVSSLWQNDWLWLAVLSLCCTVWAQSLALNSLRYLSSFTVTLTVNLEPVYGILLAFLFYHENTEVIFYKGTTHLNWGFISGMALIVLSVALQMMRMLKPRLSPGMIEEKGGID
jgi:drug/metabolite transporter (DMT)-like permease